MDESETDGRKSIWSKIVQLWKPVYSFVIGAAAFIGAIVTIISVFKGSSPPVQTNGSNPPQSPPTPPTRTVIVPDLTGLLYASAFDTLKVHGLEGEVVAKKVTEQHREGIVLDQKPEAETGMDAGGTVHIAVASNPVEVLQTAKAEWNRVLLEDFESGATRFRLGKYEQPQYVRKTRSHDRRFEIELEARQAPVFSTIRPYGIDAFTDFYLSVEATCLTKLDDIKGLVRYGLVFRYSGNDFIAFRLSNEGTFEISSQAGTEWRTEKGDITSSAIGQITMPHSLTVIGQDSLLYFYIGGKYQRYLVDKQPQDGNAGFIVAITELDQKTRIAFDNFELRIPSTR